MKQHNKNLTLNKETLTNIQENLVKGGVIRSLDRPCSSTCIRICLA